MNENLTNKCCDRALCSIAKGDIDKLSVIYNKLSRRIFMLALSILRNKESAEDIMQDTFVKIAEQAHTYIPKSNAIAFILTITRNLSLNRLAKMRQSASLERPLDDGAEIADVDNFFDTTEIGALEALQCLDETERQIIVMKLDCGMKHRHIASILGISEAACQKRYRRSLEKLKDYYAREKRR